MGVIGEEECLELNNVFQISNNLTTLAVTENLFPHDTKEHANQTWKQVNRLYETLLSAT
jgi:hypothetical protein